MTKVQKFLLRVLAIVCMVGPIVALLISLFGQTLLYALLFVLFGAGTIMIIMFLFGFGLALWNML